MILLKVYEHDHPVLHRLEEFPVVLGRSGFCAVRIDDPTVSGRHAELGKTESGYVLRDLGSTNGIVHLGERQSELNIVENATIYLGDTRVDFIVKEELAKTHLNRLPRRRDHVSARVFLPRILATLILSYAGLCLVPAADHYKEFWPPERPYEILGTGLAIWLGLLCLAFVISLFCKLNTKRFHFHRIMILMVVTFILARVLHAGAPTVIFNLHNLALAPYLLHLGYGTLVFGFFFFLLRYAFSRWSIRLRAGVAGVAAVVSMLLLGIYGEARKGFGDRDPITELGLPLLDTSKVGKTPDDLIFEVALSIAESDQNRIRILEKLEADRQDEEP